MKKKNRIIILFLLVFLGLVSFYFDSEIVKFISLSRTGFLNEFFLGLTFLSSAIIMLFFLTSLFLWNENKRRWILPLWFTLGASIVTSFLIKVSVHRLRPFQEGVVSTLPSLLEGAQEIWDFSFPSSHAVISFCAVPILAKEFPRFKWVWVLIAVLISFSRIYFGLHYMSDLIAGGIIGYLIGITIVKYEEEKQIFEKVYKRFRF